MAQTSVAVSTPTANSLPEAYRQYPATEHLTYMDVAAWGLISRGVRTAIDAHLAARRFDFGNYNFLGCAAADAAMAQVLAYDIRAIERHVVGLSHQLAQGFLDLGLPVCGGLPGPHLTHIVTIGELGSSHYGTDDERFNQLYAFLNEHDVRLSIRRGVLRFSLHMYNTGRDVEQVLELTQG
jgi:selenocysteine lyase/cysteine desulfurase